MSGNASSNGGAIFQSTDGSATVNNNIVAGNVPDGISGPFSGTNNITSGNPLLGPLGMYGGRTLTMPLLPGSPALNTAVGSTVTSDQRGFPIVGTPDIGAYEAGTTTNYDAWIWETLPANATPPQHAAATDYDGDGVTNHSEWLALTDPANAASYLRPPQPTFSGGVLHVRFPTAVGRSYSLESKTTLSDLDPWQIVPGSTFSGTGGVVTVPIAPFFGIPNYFVRVAVGL
jgi:hypothetical protein